jgi:succinoglycan biosynthesis transport protein ExoP
MNELTPMGPSESRFQMLEPMANNHAPVGAGNKFRPQKLLYFLRRFWWIPLLTVILCASAAVVRFLHTPPIFVSQGSMWETEKLRLPDGADFTSDRDNYIGTLTGLLRSRVMWEKTIAYMEAYHTNQIIRDQNGNVIPVDIQVYATPKSSIYTIAASCSNPAFAPAYLNAIMEQYREYRLNVRGEVSLHTQSSISEQVQQYERDMKKAQAALADYERSNNFSVLENETAMDGSYLVKLKTELSDYQLQYKLLEARELETEAGAGGTNLTDTIFDSLRSSGAATSSATARLDADRQLQLLKLDRERLAKNLRPTHPKMVKLDQDIARAEKLIEVYHQQNHDQIAAARQALEIRMDDVKQFIKQWEAKVANANERLAQADVLKQEVLAKQRMYDRLTALSDNVQVSQHIDQDTLEILDEATPSYRSYSGAKSMISQAAVMGLGLGLGIIFLLAWRDDRFGSLVEVAEKFGDNVVGQVPEVPRLSTTEPLALLEGNDHRHMYAESYRNLRSALLYLGVEGKRPKVLLMTSAVPGEGKSTVVTNLARAMAMGGSKVLLVDGDLRKGHIHDLLKLHSKPGLSELLRNGDNSDSYVQATDLPNFSFISRGGATHNPGDLFLSPAFDQLLARVRDQYDYVLIDSCPVFAADDTSSIAPKADGTLFVVRSHFSHSRVVREALELLFRRQALVLGLILNRSNPSSQSYHYYKYEDYYSSEDEAKTGS